jgi:hypothetical protein
VLHSAHPSLFSAASSIFITDSPFNISTFFNLYSSSTFFKLHLFIFFNLQPKTQSLKSGFLPSSLLSPYFLRFDNF